MEEPLGYDIAADGVSFVTFRAATQSLAVVFVATSRLLATQRHGPRYGGQGMSRELTVSRILIELKERIEHHRRQEVFHSEREDFHRQQKERHAADLQVARERFDTFQAAADAAGELVARPRDGQEKTAGDDSIPAGKGAVLSKLVARVVASKGPVEAFGATEITREIQERYGSRLGRKIDVRTVAAKLRRMARVRLIHRLRKGRAFHETLYSKTPGGERD